MARTRTATQRLGLLSAGALLVIFAIVIGVFVSTGGEPERAETEPVDAPIRDIMEDIVAHGDPGASSLKIELADKHDPSRKAAEISAERADPIGLQLYEVTQPRAWIYLRDGQTVFVRAESGRFEGLDIRRNQAPTAGVLQGGVEVFLYPDLGRPIVPDEDVPSVTMMVESMTFNFRVGEMTTPHTMTVVAPTWTFSGTNVRILYSEVNERIELLTVERDNRLTIIPTARRRGPADIEPGDAAGRTPSDGQDTPRLAGGGEPGADPADEPSITIYHVTLNEEVALWQEGRRIDADRLEIWARLVDNQLPTDAIEQSRAAPVLPASMPLALRVVAGAIASHMAEPIASDETQTGDFGAPITLTWGGMLELEPAKDEPSELTKNDLFARFTVEPTNRVRIGYEKADATAVCDVFEVGATRRSISLISKADDGTVIDAPGYGRFVGRAISGDGRTGVGEVDGPGSLWIFTAEQTEPDPEIRQNIRWTERADFQFALRDSVITPVLRTAMFAGAVVGVMGDGAYAGHFLRLEFAESDTQKSSLRRLVGRGGVSADDGRGGRLECDDLDVAFDDGTHGEPVDPTYLIASGDVVGVRPGEELRCGRLEAELRRSDDGDIDVHDVFAGGGVVFNGKDGIAARSQELRGNLVEQTIELIGDGSSVRRADSAINGSAITLNGISRSAIVIGAGDFEHRDGDDTFAAKWSTDMRFHDESGELRCRGDVAAGMARPDGNDSIRADELVAHFEPGGDADSESLRAGDRRLLDVYAAGASLSTEGGDPVQVRLVRYADNDPSKIERMVYLEGDELFADETRGTLRIPGRGQLVLADRADSDNQRGDSRFRWTRELLVERTEERITFLGGVELQHVRSADGEQTDLLCERLVARLEPGGDDSTPTGDLREVEATGAVYLKSGSREVAADRIDYDAKNGVAQITAAEGNLLTIFDSHAGTQMTARGVTWDMVADRVKIDRPGRVIAPQSSR